MSTDSSHVSSPMTNRCLDSKSPYVRSHSANPVAWQLWEPSTLALARSTNRLLFVSIGYSACHWCHVMAHESFSHPDVAALLNDNFIPVKIDREERPDVDRVYMDFLQATTGGGGWPLNVFVTPDLQPLFGGTYWPGPGQERPGRGGSFKVLLEKIAETWKEQEARCREDAGRITTQLRQFAQEGTLGLRGDGQASTPATGDELPDIELLEDAFQHYKARFDDKYAGFGGAPKFPTPTHLSFLLRIAQWPNTVTDIVGDGEADEAGDMVVRTLEAMAKGGIKDQVGHGFSRYSVTRDWSLPHFEKMLYDNAQLLNTYLDAWLVTKSPILLDAVHDIATYLSTAPIQSETGGFHASEDADSAPSADEKEHKEGAFYVWTDDEFRKVIGDEKAADIAAAYFNVKPDGNVARKHDIQGELIGRNTLCISSTYVDLAEKFSETEEDIRAIISDAIVKLRTHREQHRPRPHLDDKILVSWNGLAISALARTAAALSTTDPSRSSSYLTAATRAATFIRTSLYSSKTHTLTRVYREGPGTVPGFADDYAFLITGLLDLFDATADDAWLSWAHELQVTQIKLFSDPVRDDGTATVGGGGGFFSTPAGAEDILIRTKDAMDNAEPSTNGASATNLFRLAAVLGVHSGINPSPVLTPTNSNAPNSTTSASQTEARVEPDLLQQATRTIRAFDAELTQHPGLMTGLLAGVVMARLGLRSITVSGTGPIVDETLRVLREGLFPGVVLVRLDGTGKQDWLRARNETLSGLKADREFVQICAGSECRIVGGVGEVEDMLRS